MSVKTTYLTCSMNIIKTHFFFFHIKLHKIWYKSSPYFQNLDNFLESFECLFPEKLQKNDLYGAILEH